MASAQGCRRRVWRPCPHSQTTHHHHHNDAHSNTTPFYHCLHCPLHLHRPHCPHCPLHTHNNSHLNFQPLPPYVAPLPQNPHPFVPLPLPTSVTAQYKEASSSDPQISQELEHVELDDEEEDDEPVFVLTDEWREFFAKSEARRKLEKKQGKKGKK